MDHRVKFRCAIARNSEVPECDIEYGIAPDSNFWKLSLKDFLAWYFNLYHSPSTSPYPHLITQPLIRRLEFRCVASSFTKAPPQSSCPMYDHILSVKETILIFFFFSSSLDHATLSSTRRSTLDSDLTDGGL